MENQTSKKSTLLRMLLLLPLTILLTLGFSLKEATPKEALTIASGSKQKHPSLKQEIQKKASPAQNKEYNMLAHKYKTMDKENMFIKQKDVARLTHLYGLMSSNQQKQAASFPVFPPPPPPKTPKTSKPIKVTKGGNNMDLKRPPPPPVVSKAPLDHIVRMVYENAAFFFDDQRITSSKAIALLQENESLHIETETFRASNPIVHIRTKAASLND
jgi:hypothetical protein